MFKNMFKRAWLSVIRKPSRSIIIGLILFAMSNLVLAGIIIKSAVNESTEYAKQSLGSTVTLQADMSALREQSKSSDSNSSGQPSSEELANFKDNFKRPSVLRSTADDIASSSYVKDYTYSISSSANSDSLTAAESSSSSDMPGGDHKMPGQDSENSGTYTISGINAYAYIDGVENDTMSISSGTYFNEGDTGSAMISVDLAEANNLSVDSEITLTNIYTSESHTLKIIGIYDSSSNFSDANTIYMNIDTAAEFLSSDDYNNGAFSVEDVSYTMKDAANTDAFISEINTNHPELAESNIKATEDTTAYDQMVGPIESVGSFATTILIIVIVASVAIITLIVTINVKDRRYEMGVLLSLGAKKSNIIGQIFVELALVGTVAFGLSTLTSTALAQTMGQGILDSQIASSQTEAKNNFGRPTTEIGGGQGGQSNQSGQGSDVPSAPSDSGNKSASGTNENTISSIDINAQPSDFFLLFLCGYGVIILALLIPSINVLRYQPKQILQGKE